MSKRQKAWAEQKREWLMFALGGCCKYCRSTVCLTFDCIRPTGDGHHKLSQDQRMSYYLRQAEQGNLQVLCSACNSHKGNKPQPRYLPRNPRP